MSEEFAVEVQDLGKRFRIRRHGEHSTLREAVGNLFRRDGKRSFRTDRNEVSENFWSLRNVSFNVRHGETLGIIGPNGAGKTTLLKILSGIMVPSEGCVTLRGRVGSILEVGSGFHPELTGRENIFLNGTLLGMKRREIQAKFDEIVAFSGIQKFLDAPVKWYSSGMYVRLAFSVAAHLEPDVLIVDEVLSVGDAKFQEKCLQSMRKAVEQGRTIILVSHNLQSIASLCSHAIYLQDGTKAAAGPVDEVIRSYHGRNYRSQPAKSSLASGIEPNAT